MPTLNLQAKKREVKGKQVAKLRNQGQVPAVLYGHSVKPVDLSISSVDFDKIFKAAGESTLIDLTVDSAKPVKVLIQDYQLDNLKNRINHVDFYQVRMDEKLHAEINLKFINEAPAVKELSGILVTNIHELKVECLPQDLVHEIEVDLSSLKTFEDAIHVSDLKIPAGMITHHDLHDVVVLIQEPRSEKELTDLEAKPEEKVPAEAAETEAKPEEK